MDFYEANGLYVRTYFNTQTGKNDISQRDIDAFLDVKDNRPETRLLLPDTVAANFSISWLSACVAAETWSYHARVRRDWNRQNS